MTEWEFESSYPSGEIPSPRTGYNWKYRGEVVLSLFLGRSDAIPRYEIARIFEHPKAAEQLASEIDKADAIDATSQGKRFVDEPFWYGYNPNQLRKFCRQSRLPLPSGYAKNWRAIRYSSNP